MILREMTVQDVDRIYRLYEDPRVTEYMEALFSDPEEEKAYTQSYYRNVYCFYGFGIWLLERKTDGELLGRAGLEVNENGEFVLGYMLAAKYQHQGMLMKPAREYSNMPVNIWSWNRKKSLRALSRKTERP